MRLRLCSALLPMILAAGCQDPGELRPLFDSVVGLEGFLVEPDPLPFFDLPVRNVGGSPVTIDSFAFVDVSGAEGQSENFLNLTIDDATQENGNKVSPDEQFVLRFEYRTPGGQGQTAMLVVESDASNSPLGVQVFSDDYVPPPGTDGGLADGGAEDAGPTDAGGLTDAGPADAGPADAGGLVDGGSSADGGAVDGGAAVDGG